MRCNSDELTTVMFVGSITAVGHTIADGRVRNAFTTTTAYVTVAC